MFHNLQHSLVACLTTSSEDLSPNLNKCLDHHKQYLSKKEKNQAGIPVMSYAKAHIQPSSEASHTESTPKFTAGTEVC